MNEILNKIKGFFQLKYAQKEVDKMVASLTNRTQDDEIFFGVKEITYVDLENKLIYYVNGRNSKIIAAPQSSTGSVNNGE